MSVEDPHEGEASEASRSSKGRCPFGVERELRGEPRTIGETITGDGPIPGYGRRRDHATDAEVREAIEAVEDGGRDE